MTFQYYLKIFNEKEKAEVVKQLNEQFGIKEISGVITMRGKERLFLFQGSLDKNQVMNLEQQIPIERIGVYFAKYDNNKLRLSMEGTQLLKEQITRNIFEIENEKDLEIWMHGSELNIKTGMSGFIVIKYKNDFLGCGKASENKIGNFIPKSRRLKVRG